MSVNPKLSVEQLKAAFANPPAANQPAVDGTSRLKKVLIKDITGIEHPSANGKMTTMIVLEYRDLDFNNLAERKFPLFLKDQAELVLSMEIGKSYTVEQVKENGFWVWKSKTQIEN